jgi:hypothetical protein
MRKVLGVVVVVALIAGVVTLVWGQFRFRKREGVITTEERLVTTQVAPQPQLLYDNFQNCVLTFQTALEEKELATAVANTDLGLVFTDKNVFYPQDLGTDHYVIYPLDLREGILVHGGYLVRVYHSGKKEYGFAFFKEGFHKELVDYGTKDGEVALMIATAEKQDTTLSVNVAVLKHPYVYNELYLGKFGRDFFEDKNLYVPGFEFTGKREGL